MSKWFWILTRILTFSTWRKTLLNFHFDDLNHRSLITIHFFHMQKTLIISPGYHSEQIVRLKDTYIYQKAWNQSLSLASRSKGPGIARLVETSNAESPTMIYIADKPERLLITYCYTKCSGCNVYTPHRASPLLCFWLVIWIFQVLRTSKPKRTVTPFMYMSPTLAFPHEGLPARVGAANVQNKLNNKNYKWYFFF